MSDQIIQQLLPVAQHYHLLGYWVAFLSALLETLLVVGLFIPGSTLLLFLGALTAGDGLDFAGIYWSAVAGAVLGDNINYWIGRRFGHARGGKETGFIRPDQLHQARRFFRQHGARGVFLGRFVPGMKEVIPLVAGSMGMERGRFLLWNLLGALGWGLEWVGGGHLFAQSLNLARVWISRTGVAALVLLLLFLLLWLAKCLLQRHGPGLLEFAGSLARSIGRAVRNDARVRALVERHPAAARFLAGRVDASRFTGLPLTLLLLAFGYVLALFAGVVEDLVTADPVVAVDHAVAQLVAAHRAPGMVPPLLWITSLGSSAVVVPFLLLAAAALWLSGARWLLLPLVTSSLGAAGFTALGKVAFHRPRPPEALLLEHSYSFPSGHATIAVAFYGFLGYLAIRTARGWKQRFNRLLATLFVILAIGSSRVLLGVHYLSDVWAGYLVGALWLIVGISLAEWLASRGRVAWHFRAGIRRRWMASLGVAALAWYLLFTWNWHPAANVPPPVEPEVISGPVPEFLRQRGLAFTRTLIGKPEQPLGFAMAADSMETLVALLEARGWRRAEPLDTESLSRLLRQGMEDPAAPVAPGFWNERLNDMALEKPATLVQGRPGVVAVRLWKTPFRLPSGETLFVGTARAYDGMEWGVLRHPSPDVDWATQLFVQDLLQSGRVRQPCRAWLTRPRVGRYLLGEPFFTRGGFWLLTLSPGRMEKTSASFESLRCGGRDPACVPACAGRDRPGA